MFSLFIVESVYVGGTSCQENPQRFRGAVGTGELLDKDCPYCLGHLPGLIGILKFGEPRGMVQFSQNCWDVGTGYFEQAKIAVSSANVVITVTELVEMLAV